jgi:hypothetical protein
MRHLNRWGGLASFDPYRTANHQESQEKKL